MEKPLTDNFKKPGEPPPDIDEYQKAGGYQALRKALRDMTPDDVVKAVKDSGLRGRGGAGFLTGLKWGFVPRGKDNPIPSFVIANADEMEPGAFKDRLLLENGPHQLLEGLILAAYALQAEVAYIFIRREYVRAARVLEQACREAYTAGYLGKNILSSSFNLELTIHRSAGRYICGEETGLINSLEGRTAIPRTKPPFPPVSGLWGKPTTVNNVETLCNVPHIVNNGPSWFKGLSATGEGGTKIYGVSGKVKHPGAFELPLGATLREVLHHAGAMADGLTLRGVLPGGASTDFMLPEHLDVPLDFSAPQKVGSRLGTGTVIVLDDQTCPVAFLANIEKFFARESCGWCTPCREGLPWVYRLLEAIERGEGREGDIEVLLEQTRLIGPLGHTFCALAPGAMEPLQSGLKYFRQDFEEHLGRKCRLHPAID